MSINWNLMFKWGIFSFSLFIIGCATLPKQEIEYSNFEKIEVGFGPEDFQLDSTNGRLLVACDERRKGESLGEVWSVDLKDFSSKKLPLFFAEDNVVFHPHGMSIIDDYLFVISHKNKNTEEFYRFKILKDSLIQDTIFSEGIIGIANDIYAVSKDEFYYTDFKMLGGSIVHFKDDKYQKFSKHYKYPNGLIIVDSMMFVTTSLSNKLFEVNLESGKKKKLIKQRGGDNLQLNGNTLYAALHPKMIKFIKHAKDASNPSPSLITSYNIATKTEKVLYSENGETISAASTGWVYQDFLIIGQIFDNYLLIGKMK